MQNHDSVTGNNPEKLCNQAIEDKENLMKTFTITGGAGFIGSHLAELLLKKGHKVQIIDDLSTGSLSNICHLKSHPNFSFAIDSITNPIVMDRLISRTDVVIHLAAAVGVQLILDNPVQVLRTNIEGTQSVFETALRYRAKVLFASTSEVYGKLDKEPFKEEDDVVLGPTTKSRWSYAVTKLVDEFLGFAFNEEFGLSVTAFRLFNTVGPRQSGDYGMVIPRFVQQALAGKKLTVYGDGSQRRCFMHVNDAIQAIYALAELNTPPHKVFNIGTTEPLTITDLAYKILKVVRPQDNPEDFIDYIPYEKAFSRKNFEDMQSRKPDTSRIREATQWSPGIGIDQIITDVVDYYSK